MPHPDSIPAFWTVSMVNDEGRVIKVAAYLEEPREAIREATLYCDRHHTESKWKVTGEGLERGGGPRWIPREAVLAEYPYLRED